MKAQAALILILILLVFLGIFFLVPKTPSYQPSAKEEVITLEEYVARPLNLRAGDVATIEFSISNNDNKVIKNVEVNFFDLSGMTIEELRCEEKKSDQTCFFDEIEPFYPKEVFLKLRAPSLSTQVSLTVSFYVKYDYSGFGVAKVPIIDGVTIKRPPKPFTSSESSSGPIKLDFKLPERGERKEDSKIIKESWAYNDEEFKVLMNFDFRKKTSAMPVVINKDKTTLSLVALRIDERFSCDFEGSKAKKDVIVPGSLSCYFIPLSSDLPLREGKIEVSFDYTYQFTKTETFSVIP
jgi:hypothetical protein